MDDAATADELPAVAVDVAGETLLAVVATFGVAEVVLIGMLAPIAGQEYVNQVAAGVLLYRLFTWLALIPAGMIALGIWKFSFRQKARQETNAA